MNYSSYSFMHKVFPLLDRACLWKSFYSAWLRFGAVCVGLLGLYLVAYNSSKILAMDLGLAAGFLAFKVGILTTAYMLSHLLWHRSHSIRELDEDSYPVLRIFAHIARLSGEIFALASFGMSLGAGLAILFAGQRVLPFTLGIGVNELSNYGVFNGVLTMVFGLGYSVLGLLAGRMCYELMVLMIDMAQNVRKMRQALSQSSNRENRHKNAA